MHELSLIVLSVGLIKRQNTGNINSRLLLTSFKKKKNQSNLFCLCKMKVLHSRGTLGKDVDFILPVNKVLVF